MFVLLSMTRDESEFVRVAGRVCPTRSQRALHDQGTGKPTDVAQSKSENLLSIKLDLF